MKEKLKKAFQGVTAYLVLAWLNIASFGYTVAVCISEASYTTCLIALPFLLIALLAFDCHRKEKELGAAKGLAVMAHLFGLKLYKELERYKQQYGELPPEEETETKEEAKEEPR